LNSLGTSGQDRIERGRENRIPSYYEFEKSLGPLSVLFILDGRFTLGREQVSMTLDITSGADERYLLKQLENQSGIQSKINLGNDVYNKLKV
jgi:hypothetical protein